MAEWYRKSSNSFPKKNQGLPAFFAENNSRIRAMTITKFLQKAEIFQIEACDKPQDLKVEHVPFSGALRKHPHDSEKILLIADPYSGINSFYEFMAEDISFVEELENIADIDGNTVKIFRIWIKKKSIGLHCSAFVVEETRRL